MSANFYPKHNKDRARHPYKDGDKCHVVVSADGTFRSKTGDFGDAGDAELYTLAGAHRHANGNGTGVLNVAQHPQLAILFFTNR